MNIKLETDLLREILIIHLLRYYSEIQAETPLFLIGSLQLSKRVIKISRKNIS